MFKTFSFKVNIGGQTTKYYKIEAELRKRKVKHIFSCEGGYINAAVKFPKQ